MVIAKFPFNTFYISNSNLDYGYCNRSIPDVEMFSNKSKDFIDRCNLMDKRGKTIKEKVCLGSEVFHEWLKVVNNRKPCRL